MSILRIKLKDIDNTKYIDIEEKTGSNDFMETVLVRWFKIKCAEYLAKRNNRKWCKRVFDKVSH